MTCFVFLCYTRADLLTKAPLPQFHTLLLCVRMCGIAFLCLKRPSPLFLPQATHSVTRQCRWYRGDWFSITACMKKKKPIIRIFPIWGKCVNSMSWVLSLWHFGEAAPHLQISTYFGACIGEMLPIRICWKYVNLNPLQSSHWVRRAQDPARQGFRGLSAPAAACLTEICMNI